RHTRLQGDWSSDVCSSDLIVHTRSANDANQEFTNNKRLLLAAIDKTTGYKLRSATAEKTDEYYRTRDMRQSGDALNDPTDQERRSEERRVGKERRHRRAAE